MRHRKKQKTDTSSFPNYKCLSDIPDEIRMCILRDIPNRLSPKDLRNRVQKSSNIYKALKMFLSEPRMCHFKYLEKLNEAELKDPQTVRTQLLKAIEFSHNEKVIQNRNLIFSHLWKEIASCLPTVDCVEWGKAFPHLVPTVCHHLFLQILTMKEGSSMV